MDEAKDPKRRLFLKMAAGSLGGITVASLWPGLIEQALATEPNNPTGIPSLADIEHVVIFMQENRAFDHYFGMLPGVRGYGDPRPVPLPSGNYVWCQPEGLNPASRGFSDNVPWEEWGDTARWRQAEPSVRATGWVLPFPLNGGGNTQYQHLTDLNHDWKKEQAIWANWNAWIPLKSRESMGYLTAPDLPFYYRLASAFTVLDNYYAALFGPTDPNRVYLWSGTFDKPDNIRDDSGSHGYEANIDYDVNDWLTPAMYGQSAAARAATVAAGIPDWPTFAETLTDHGITWKVYQEEDNYGDNALQWFKNFRVDNHGVPINRSRDPYFRTLYLRGRTFATSTGGYGLAVLQEFADDVAAGSEPDNVPLGAMEPGLPRVSWVVAPYAFCEHPSAASGYGEEFTAQLLKTLVVDHPDVFKKTVFILTYDENDGFFDHVPAPIPPITANYGQMTLANAGSSEVFDEQPVGFGPRVPMVIVSPWTGGGRVDSQLSNHTSILQFLERWLAAKQIGHSGPPRCDLISPWRRAVSGDLTEAFDFSRTTTPRLDLAARFRNGNVVPSVPDPQVLLPQPHAIRPACVLPSRGVVAGTVGPQGLALRLRSTGNLGATFLAYWWPMTDRQTALHYTVGAGSELAVPPRLSGGRYDCLVFGTNGYLRDFRGGANATGDLAVTLATGYAGETPMIVLDNRGSAEHSRVWLWDNVYAKNLPVEVDVPAGEVRRVPWQVDAGWYDFGVGMAGRIDYYRRLAGCVESDSPVTDPAIGNRELFQPRVWVHGDRYTDVRFDYVTPPWLHRAGNWLGVFAAGTGHAGEPLRRLAVPRALGSVALSAEHGNEPLPAGQYEVWYLSVDGRTPLMSGPTTFTLRNL